MQNSKHQMRILPKQDPWRSGSRFNSTSEEAVLRDHKKLMKKVSMTQNISGKECLNDGKEMKVKIRNDGQAQITTLGKHSEPSSG